MANPVKNAIEQLDGLCEILQSDNEMTDGLRHLITVSVARIAMELEKFEQETIFDENGRLSIDDRTVSWDCTAPGRVKLVNLRVAPDCAVNVNGHAVTDPGGAAQGIATVTQCGPFKVSKAEVFTGTERAEEPVPVALSSSHEEWENTKAALNQLIEAARAENKRHPGLAAALELVETWGEKIALQS